MNKTTKIALALAVIGVLTKVVHKTNTYQSVQRKHNKASRISQVSLMRVLRK